MDGGSDNNEIVQASKQCDVFLGETKKGKEFKHSFSTRMAFVPYPRALILRQDRLQNFAYKSMALVPVKRYTPIISNHTFQINTSRKFPTRRKSANYHEKFQKMEKLTKLAHNFIVTLRQASHSAVLSHLCGLRSLDDKLAPHVSSSENEMVVITAPYQKTEPAEDRAICKGRGQKLKPTGSVVFVLGAPGTGKGTQCAFLAQEFGFHHLSYGDLCRRLRKDQDPIVSRLDTKDGSNNPNVPDDLGAWLMWKEVRKEPGRRWLLDGFPKRVEHLEEFLNLMPPPSLTLIFGCPQKISEQRVAKRGKMAGEQARPEDLNANVSRKRIEDSHRNLDRVLQALQEKGMKFVVVNTNRTEDSIQAELRKVMSAHDFAR